MLSYTFLLASLAAALSCFSEARHFLFILQQQKFDHKYHLQWQKKKMHQILPKQLLSLATVFFTAYLGEVGLILSGITYIFLNYIYQKRRYSFSFTKHMVKIICLTLLLCCTGIGFAFSTASPLAVACIFSVLYCCLPGMLFSSSLLFSLGKRPRTSSL